MNIFRAFERDLRVILEQLQGAGQLPPALSFDRITVEPPRDPSHGDLATNAAMVLARPAGLTPRPLAETLAARFADHPDVVEATVAGPGFVNLRLADHCWQACLGDALRTGTAYGDSAIGAGVTVNVEFVSANPTGPLTAAHARGAVVGDALAALLEKVGHRVVREYYINDAGAQVDTLARSAFLRYREALGEGIGEIPAGLYPGQYLCAVGRALAERHGDALRDQDEAAWLPVVRDAAVAMQMAAIKQDLALLGIEMDVFSSERALVEAGAVDAALARLTDQGHVYTGVLEPPKGKLPEDWEPRPQTLFRSTAFGDDVDRPVKKSDGSWTYFANDIAYHYDKVCRGFRNLIDIVGADHAGYVKRMQAAVRAISDGAAALDVKLCQLVHLFQGGVPVKMSKRAGTFVTLRDVIEEVGGGQIGRGVVRFIMLTRRNDQTLDFDLARVTELSKDNPVFYVQYAHARCHSVLRHAGELWPDGDLSGTALARAPLGRLSEPDELALIRRLAGWPRQVEAAAEAHEPHRIAFYLSDLAAEFHALWNRGRDDTSLRFLVAGDDGLSRARLALVRGVATVIASGLAIMGVDPVEEMRA